MNKLNNLIDRFCYRYPRFGIPNLTMGLVIGNIIVYLLDMISRTPTAVSTLLSFSRNLILQGQVWRIISFVFAPFGGSPIFFVLEMYFLWFIGTSLEREWGTCKFTTFYLIGWFLAVVSGFITGAASTGYLNLTMFLAFATLYPDTQFLIFFIIPVRAKILGWIDGALLGFSFITNLVTLQFGGCLLILMAIFNYLVFFWPELMYFVRRWRGQAKHSRKQSTIDFKKAAKDLRQREYIHKCTVCGRTDADYPDLEFRYCSRCTGYHCYCIDHINNHVHITE